MSRKHSRGKRPGARSSVDPARLWQQAVDAFQRGDAARAKRAVAPLLDHPAADGTTFLLAGLAAARLADWPEAEKWLRKAVHLAPERIEGWLTLGNALHALGRMEEAAEVLKTATGRAPDNPQGWNNLAVVHEDMGRMRDALDYYDRTLKIEPGFTQALHGRATVLGQLRWFDEARQAYETLIGRFPDEPALRLEYAELLEQANRPEEAAQHLPAPESLGDKQTNARAAYLHAQLAMRDGGHEAALERLAAARQRTGKDFLSYREGMILDRLGRYPEAMAAFTRANQARAAQADFRRLLAQPVTEYLDHKLEAGSQPAAAPAAGAGDDGPVFVTGLPRSGTTLLDRMLFAHPEIQVLEELEALRMAEGAFAEGASPDEARRLYWEFIERHVELQPGRVIVDKNPLHVMHLDVLPHLFPGSRVIFVLRHPFDAALSCFMQDFNPGPVTARFLALDSTAALCAQFLRLMRQVEAARPDAVTRVHYESLVSDFHSEVRRVLRVIGLDWHADIEDYAGIAARAAPIMTASYEQVTRRLYRSSVARWKHYDQWLAPFHETLGGLLADWDYDAA